MQRDALRYRTPLRVKKILVFSCGDSYPICPRCKCLIDREYMAFCSSCGQRLSWNKFESAKICLAQRN